MRSLEGVDPTREAEAIVAGLRALGDEPVDPAPVIRTAMVFYGVSVRDLRRIAAAWHREHPDADPRTVGALADELWGRGVREEMVVATMLLGRTARTRSVLDLDRIDAWGSLLDCWETTDQLGMGLVGPWVVDDLAGRMPLLGELTTRVNPWLRRLALVVAAHLGRVEDAPWEPVATLVRSLASDREAAIPKAISWVLRSHLRHRTAEVLALLENHRAEIPAIARREALRKAETGSKR